MPELPEVEHVVRALRRVLPGRQILASQIRLPKLVAPLTPAQFNRRIKGARITALDRRGKFILIKCEQPARHRPRRLKNNELVLAVHLRMTGKFLYLTPDDELPKHAHAIFYLDNDRRLVFRDQRQFGVMKLIEAESLQQTKGIKELAPEPFGDDFDERYLKATLKASRRTLKTLLLDQTKVLGLGNIYAAEALFRAGINPFKPASQLSSRRTAALYQSIRDVLSFAVNNIRGESLRAGFSYGEAFERFWQVYEREGEPCFKCGTRIRRAQHGGRSTYWCPKCQRR